MSEQGPPPFTALTDERDEPADKRKALRRQLAEDVDRLIEGIDHDDVLRRAFKITGDLYGAEDVQQNLYRNLLCLPEERRAAIRTLEKYISASVRNLSIQWLKQHLPPQHESLDDDFAERMIDDFTNQLADEDEIEFMLRRLPVDCREAVMLYFGEGYTAAEVARRLGINTEALRKRMQKAVIILAKARKAYLARMQ